MEARKDIDSVTLALAPLKNIPIDILIFLYKCPFLWKGGQACPRKNEI